jgi:PhnB protein
LGEPNISKTVIQPYLFFSGRCEEVLEFYKTTIGAQVEMVMHFNESPDLLPPSMLQPGFENQVIHAAFRVG